MHSDDHFADEVALRLRSQCEQLRRGLCTRRAVGPDARELHRLRPRLPLALAELHEERPNGRSLGLGVVVVVEHRSYNFV